MNAEDGVNKSLTWTWIQWSMLTLCLLAGGGERSVNLSGTAGGSFSTSTINMASGNVTPTTTAHRSTSRLDQRGCDLYISSIVREIETICILLALSSSQGTGCVAASRRCPSWQLHSNGERGESFLLVVLRLLQTYYINCRE